MPDAVPSNLMQPTPFTSRGEVVALASALGVDLRTEDAESPENLIAYYVSAGTGDVLFYVWKFAPAAVLAAVPWVRQQATIRAALLLTGHGGEPMNETLSALWDECVKKLEMVLSHQASIPQLPDQSPGENFAPAVLNPRIDMQLIPAVRRVAGASTDVGGVLFRRPDVVTDWRGRQ